MPLKSSLAAPKDTAAPKKTLFDDDDGDDTDREEGGASLQINQDFARRFEHNQKRTELHRLEEKYKSSRPPTKGGNGEEEEDDDGGGGGGSSSSDESEDDDAFLVTEDLDAEISATLAAIKKKDPRIYDKEAVFYQEFDPSAAHPKPKEEKPMHLADYHRERYMRGDVGDHEPGHDKPKSYIQQQDDLKQTIMSEIQATLTGAGSESEDWSDDDTFLKPKPKPEAHVQQQSTEDGVHPARAAALQQHGQQPQKKLTEKDVASADQNPDEFLSKFMTSRAWAPPPDDEGGQPAWKAFESDDDDDDNNLGLDQADEFEHAYNMRFEDPSKSNEVLKSYSRNVVGARSVRKEELTGRKRARALEKERKEAEKREREKERARLLRLKVEQAAEKLAKIKKAAGMRGKMLSDEEWVQFLDEAWEDDAWEKAMQKRFGDHYYAEPDEDIEDEEGWGSSEGEGEGEGGGRDGDEGVSAKKAKSKSKTARKPKWDDDIDIKDLVPDFDESIPQVSLSDQDEEGPDRGALDQEAHLSDDDDAESSRLVKKRKTTGSIKKERIAIKRAARQELVKLEAFVDSKMALDNPRILQTSESKPSFSSSANQKLRSTAASAAAATGTFRYREESPNSFGLTARDILLAPSDTALNEFAGLKKLAKYRDPAKKERDRKRLGKRYRLRKWRAEQFGSEFALSGPTYGFDRMRQQREEEGGGEVKLEGGQGRHHHQRGGAKSDGKKKKDHQWGPAETTSEQDAASGHVVGGERKKKRKRSKKGGGGVVLKTKHDE